MGILGEVLIITATTAAGTLLSYIPGFPFPGSVTGMLLMLILLLSGLIKLEQIKYASGFFLGFLPLFFIPLIVNLLEETEILGQYGVKLLIIIIGTSVITLITTGLTAKLLINIMHKKKTSDA